MASAKYQLLESLGCGYVHNFCVCGKDLFLHGFPWDTAKQILDSSYGRVMKALDCQTTQVVAIKAVPIETDNVKELSQEIEILKKCHSKYVVNYIESFRNDNELWVPTIFFFAPIFSSKKTLYQKHRKS
ncbi:serine/threonine-protein kinase 3 [Reticulomyxa filosa]|uniref:Serine/threonine-protein kinase 3 n=1 Tax=Reticulomyxa filosa TaxID=46433 RepID=X6P232_RETFI|nr:serine/threonine-protein kinase 3 [Reticulomyxa filosa]|eukprot:ETO31617.1 serine/threonine-protein kinase 3 [Reticulomyxa filosa]